MKNLLYVIIILGILGGAVYYNKINNYNVTVDPVVYSNQSSANNNKNKIISSDRDEYKNLNELERNIVDRYFSMKNNNAFYDPKSDSCYLKYYNDTIAFVGCSRGKPGSLYNLFNYNKSEIISDTFHIFSYIESDKYIVFLCDEGIDQSLCYYKVGNDLITTIKDGTTELKTNNDSYIAYVGPGGPEYDFKIEGNTLTAGIYDKRYHDNGLYKKLREVQFVLE